jgi:transposase
MLHRLGFSYKKPKVVPGKADLIKQKLFVEEYKRLKGKLGINDQIYFGDSTHPEHNTRPSYGWILKGKVNDKYIKTNTGRERLNLTGAISLGSKNGVFLEQKTINSSSIIKLLRKIQVKQPKGKIYLILDNASYHHSKQVKEYLKQKRRIKLIFLPPYSPNLNPIERLWRLMHQKLTWNRYFETYKEFRNKTLTFFRNLNKYRPELDSLITDNFQLLPT